MAPRKPKKVVSVTKKKKVVKETIKVTVSEGDPNVTTETENDQETQELTFTETENDQETQEFTFTETENDQETQYLTYSIPVGENATTVEIPVENRDELSPQPPGTPASKSETVKKTHKAEKKGKRKRKTKKRDDLAGDEYRRYVYRVMKQVHPELGITSKAMTVVNMFMGDMFERIAEEAARLSDYSKRRTLSAREIEAAVRLVLPGELSRHAVAEGSKAIANYVAHKTQQR